MKTRASIAVLALGVFLPSTMAAVVTTLTSPQQQHTPTATVTFDGPHPNPTNTYSEAGVTISTSDGSNLIRPLSAPTPGDRELFSFPTVSYVFPSPTREVGWDERFNTSPTVKLFADTAGNQLIGEYSIAIAFSQATPRFHGFQSDTPFRRMMFTGTMPTHIINNMRYTPEPTMLLATCGGCLLLASRSLFTRSR